MEFFEKLFDSDFMPHGHCYFWDPAIVWTNAISDSLIALAYFTIPFTLLHIVRVRKDLKFTPLIILFAAFILSCGATHIMDVINIWYPMYRLDSSLRAITALASIGTAVMLVKITPQIFSIPNTDEHKKLNEELKEQINLLKDKDQTIELLRKNREIEDAMTKSEGRLKRSEEQFRVFADSIQDLAWIADGEGSIYWYNQRWLDYTGLTLEDMKGWGWQKVHHPDHVEKVIELSKELWKKVEPFELTFPLRRFDGEYRWFLTRAYPVIDVNGNIERWIGTNTDITEQKTFTEELEKKVEERTEELTARNAFIETLINSSTDLIIAFDKDLRYLSINKVANETFAAHFPNGVIGKKLDEVITSAHETGVYANVLSALQGNIVSQKEYISFYEKKYYDVDFIPLRNEKEVYGVMAVSRDVTENVLASLALKKANSELEERKNLVEIILESSKEYIAVYAKDFRLISINKATEVLMGRKREEVIGKTLLELMPQSKGSKEESDLQSALNGNSVHNEAYQSFLTGRYIENYINPLKNSEGNVFAAVVLGNDVTNIISRQREIEVAREQLQIQNETFKAAENIGRFGSYKWILNDNTLEYSANLFRLFGFEPNEFVPSFEKFISFIHPDDREQVIKNGEETAKTGELVETPYRILTKQGEVRHFRSSGSFTGEYEKKVLIGTVQDITKDVLAADELQIKNHQLKSINDELSSFAFIASHDLKEPLRKIQSISDLILRSETLSDKTIDYFSRIVGASARMQSLIESLLEYSRTNTTQLVFESCDLEMIVGESKQYLQETILEKEAKVETKNLPIVNGVRIMIFQLVNNFIDNAIKYSRPAVKPIITISASIWNGKEIEHPYVNKMGKYYRIDFADNGIGFEQQYEHKIFELFQRLHNKNEYSGTGLGLAICKKIVVNHGGFLTATGNPGAGSTFHVYLPLQ